MIIFYPQNKILLLKKLISFYFHPLKIIKTIAFFVDFNGFGMNECKKFLDLKLIEIFNSTPNY